MNKKYLQEGRKNQKLKTRLIILNAAQDMLKTRLDITLEEVAEYAGVSRATIYRYFPNINLLVGEAGINISTKKTEDLLADVEHLDLKEALHYVQKYFNDLAKDNEIAFRQYLSVALKENSSETESKSLRGGRRLAIAEAIIENKAEGLSEKDKFNLSRIIAVLSGFEPFVANVDVNGLSVKESAELLDWALDLIIKGVSL